MFRRALNATARVEPKHGLLEQKLTMLGNNPSCLCVCSSNRFVFSRPCTYSTINFQANVWSYGRRDIWIQNISQRYVVHIANTPRQCTTAVQPRSTKRNIHWPDDTLNDLRGTIYESCRLLRVHVFGLLVLLARPRHAAHSIP